MGESLGEELKKAIRLARKRHEAERTVETEALNDAAAVAVKQRTDSVGTIRAFQTAESAEEDETR
jgi:hypothetical protein